ncbi:MAG: class I SAM-dependent methyltransferase [Vicinamibacteria bacterium]|nr:class I SAM-dependent methyltransferase [Vicinamibacteria bacterium]
MTEDLIMGENQKPDAAATPEEGAAAAEPAASGPEGVDGLQDAPQREDAPATGIPQVDALRALAEGALRRVSAAGHPNADPLAMRLQEIDTIALNIKFFGYDLARRLAAELPVRDNLRPRRVGLTCKPSTQDDLESDWVAYWCSQLKVPVVFHRKLWELAYVLQACRESGMMRASARGLGFGCGQDPLASYFAGRDLKITATDLPLDRVQSAGWEQSGQHASALDSTHKPYLVSRDQFEKNVRLRHVDMNDIPPDLADFDFCWSVCALEHLGSIEKGLRFVENSLATLRPGGLSVHTTEFNFADDAQTIDEHPTVLFQKRHFQDLKERLGSAGHVVAPLDFDVGSKPLDRFIDLPPFRHDWPASLREQWGAGEAHIKLSVHGFPVTCFGIIVRKSE